MRAWLPRALLVATIVAAPAGSLAAQIDYFGQNKIQYRDFAWRVLRGEHVDLYYYPEADELARVALAYAEETFRYLELKFGHSPSSRIPLITYASHTDFEQTNLLPFVPPEGLLGFTEFLRRRVALPFTGSYAAFRHTLRHELVHAFQLSILAESYARHPRGGRPHLPLWWSEGIAEFWSAGEDAQDEMVLRDITISGRLPSLEYLTYVQGGIVYPLGGAIHRWLAERYGEWRVQLIYRDLWKYGSFEEAILGVYGISLDDLNAEWQDAFRRKYYPTVAERRPLSTTSEKLTELAIKPVAYRLPGDSTTRFLYLSPQTGYMNIYSATLFGRSEPQVVVRGERSAEFESFHPFASRMDVREGVAVFTSKYLERDALFFWDLAKNEVVGRYQFPELVSLLSPTWAPDGRSIVFSGLSVGGYSDLYRLSLPGGELEQLTQDRYEDLDPSFSPDGTRIVFASDRTVYGMAGRHNLFIMDLASRRLRYLTRGDWEDQTPRWGKPDRIFFTSDRDGILDIYSVDTTGSGRRETNTQNGTFDPQWVEDDGVLVFAGFADLSFGIFRALPPNDSIAPPGFTLASDTTTVDWMWSELTDSPYARADPRPYERRFSLDFAAGDAFVAPGVGSAQGAIFLFSDMLSDHQLAVALTSFQGNGIGGFIDNVNGSVFYLNQKRRLNWGLGAFRLKGLFYEGDLNTLFDETSYGGFADLRFPFSRFSRVEGQLRLEHSDRFDLAGGDLEEPRRVGWLASNYVSFVRDNSLWLPTGPIDGQRLNITVGVTNDLSNGRFDAWTLAADNRRYFRIGLQSAYAVRAFGYIASGKRPRRVNIGGSWGLRGYPRIGGVAGTRAFLLSQEVRFPIADFLSIGFPFGELRFPGVQGALFADLGGAWTETTSNRGVLGSGGFGLRTALGPLVLRFDFGQRFEVGDVSGYPFTNDRGRRFVDFFFGFNY